MHIHVKRALLFFCCLLLGGLCQVVDSIVADYDNCFISTLMFCTYKMTYCGLILHFVQSVRRRLLPSPAKNYMIASGLLMLFFLLVQTVCYRIVQWSIPIDRHCWYLYYVPIILVPTLFLMSSYYFGDRPIQHSRIKRYPLFLGLILIFGILTNDLHHLAFKPNPDIDMEKFIGKSGTYTHGILFYAAYIWAGLMLAASIVHLISSSHKMQDWRKAISPFLCILLVPMLTTINKILVAADLPEPFKMAEIMIFCMIGVQEYCIRNRLLPHNINYDSFFSQLELPVCITDYDVKPVYQTTIPVHADKDQMRQAVGDYVYTEQDTRLSGMELHGGYAFFASDESELHRLNEELEDANDILSMENELIEHENELLEEKAAIEEQNRLYDDAASAVYDAQKRIEAALKFVQPDMPSYRRDIAFVLFIMAYVKRKANFVMLNADHGSITPYELTVALKESLRFLNYCGVETDARITVSKDYSWEAATAIYDCFEAAAEVLCGRISELWMHLTENEMLLLTDAAQAPELPELPLPVSCSCDDGQTVIRVQIGGDDK
ncbi:histidine kinase N-terminal 7TM domain-containing protein [Ruminococcus sp.]|uniref:histidine kinase N-terminal 7TM domain-containing protein n=1 Tax=Ruminococcus sp. TaxID=41978 RepID=UPI0025D0E55F|nr:histidine kinase N-terminal 7TM domain-containing protein [Ruminococcus sp.]